MQQYENDKEKDIRIPWDQYEVALLIDAYNQIINNPENRTNIIKNLSIKLRNRAKNYLHIEVNDTFRNYNGINMRIGNIQYLFTNGLNGLSSCSQLDKKIYELYENNYGEFRRIKDIAEKQANNQNVCIDISNEIYESNNQKPYDSRTMLSTNTYFDISSLDSQTTSNLENKKNIDSNNRSNVFYVLSNNQLPKNYFLSINEVFDDEWILKYCKKFHLNNIGLLVNKFPDIFINSDEIIMQDIYFEKENIIKSKLKDLGITKYPVILTKDQILTLNIRKIEECFNLNYEQELYQNIIQELINLQEQIDNNKNDFITKREFSIILKRNGVNCEKHSLEALGKQYGISRERIRQIEKKTIDKIRKNLSLYLAQLNREIKTIFDTYGLIFYNGTDFKIDNKDLIENVLKHSVEKFFYFNYDYNLICAYNFDIEKMFATIIKEIENNGKKFIKKEEIILFLSKELSKYFHNETEIQKDYFNYILQYISCKFIEDYFILLENDLYKQRSGKLSITTKDKNEILAYFFEKLYKTPVKIPQRNETAIKQNLAELFKSCSFLNEYNGSSAVERMIKDNKDIVFYGMGKYIHINNTNVNLDFIDSIILDVLKLFSQGKKEILADELYNSNSYKYKNANIPDEYALIGLIQYKNHPNIFCDMRRMKILPCGKIQTENYTDKDNQNDIPVETIDKINTILLDFPQGLRINMINISINRFRQKYQALYNEECLLSTETIINILQKVGVNYNGIIFAPKNLIDEKLSTNIDNYINDIFIHRNILYIDCIYKRFERDFVGTIIDSPEILGAYLNAIYNSRYYITKEYIASDVNAKASPLEDIKEYLFVEKTPKDKQELYEYFYNYSESSIDEALTSDKEIISNKQNMEYFHYMSFNIDNFQLNSIKNIIINAIDADGYITGTSLYDIIEKEYNDILMQNPFITPMGLRKSVAILLEDEFTFNGNIISSVENSSSSTDIFKKYFDKHNNFTYDNINELSDNIGRPSIPWALLFNSHIRINENEFRRIEKSDFNIEIIDRYLKSICQNTFTPIKNILFFDTFPSCKYTWNGYLLESYVNCISNEYKLMSTGFVKSSINGIIIPKDSSINNINDLLIEVISTYDENLTNTTILEKLKQDGYIIRARIDNLEELKIKAQEVRNSRRMKK